MITKRELLSMCMQLFDDVDELEFRLNVAEKAINEFKTPASKRSHGAAKQKVGRPRKDCKK